MMRELRNGFLDFYESCNKRIIKFMKIINLQKNYLLILMNGTGENRKGNFSDTLLI